jgi:hypothetical protein
MGTDTAALTPSTAPVGHEGARVEIRERPAGSVSGWLGVLLALVCVAVTLLLSDTSLKEFAGPLIFVALVVLVSLVVVQPGQTRVVQFFGRYVGTVRRPGLSMILPLSVRRGVSVRVRNFETNHLKVNDAAATRWRSPPSWCGRSRTRRRPPTPSMTT